MTKIQVRLASGSKILKVNLGSVNMKTNELNEEEKKVIEEKGTEAPFSGEYENFYEDGIYLCRRCGAPLYRSEDKFDAHCGWPSFDAEVAGAVRRTLDEDGVRTEITCERCGAHLGHVFEGEKMTDKNIRHCVNSISMEFVPKDSRSFIEKAYFGGGCFWCTEATFQRLKGVKSVLPGFAGGEKENPIYEEVSGGHTGHAEVIEVEYDSSLVSFEILLSVFFAVHDPTTLNRQGADVGTQYRSIILYIDDAQKEVAQNFIKKLEAEKYFEKPIVTEIKPLGKFYPAEDYHKNYFKDHPEVAYCQIVIAPKIDKLVTKFKNLLQ